MTLLYQRLEHLREKLPRSGVPARCPAAPGSCRVFFIGSDDFLTVGDQRLISQILQHSVVDRVEIDELYTVGEHLGFIAGGWFDHIDVADGGVRIDAHLPVAGLGDQIER